MISLDQLISDLNLQPLPGEGGMWAPIFNNGAASAIYFLMADPDFSAWHRIPEQEMWIHVAGSPTALYTINSHNVAEKLVLDSSSGSYQSIVKPGQWMAARSMGPWSLVICTLSPAFTAMELADRSETKNWISEGVLAEEIARLFHD